MGAELLDAIVSWKAFVVSLVVLGLVPGVALRLIVRTYPRDDPRRRELLAELYAVPRLERPYWVMEQLEVALFEGLGERIRRQIKKLPQPAPRLQPGDPWTGPHAGTRYTLAVGGNDIKYWRRPRPGLTEEHRLSDHVGQRAAAQLANRLGQIKGLGGGRIFYVNESREFIAPIANRDGDVSYVYLGPLADDLWFPADEPGSM